MPSRCSLNLQFRPHELASHSQTVLHHEHKGSLKVLKSLYPEGPQVCHCVLVHPPSGIVGGDHLDVAINVASNAHALITTPAATRFYRSEGALAQQTVNATVAAGARLEWLPLETIAYSGCIARNHLRFELEPGAQMLGWDVLTLGLPMAHAPFVAGQFEQHLEIAGAWLERGVINAKDELLLNSPLGMAGNKTLSCLFFASGDRISDTQRDALLEIARDLIAPHPCAALAGVTSPNPHVLVLRVLSDVAELPSDLLRRVWAAWRTHVWGRPQSMPRIWSM